MNILTSPNARKLFALGKDWILASWKEKNRDILKIEVLPKVIGRNAGFILDVYVGNPCEKVRYFAKIQSPHIDTVTTHYLLKHINCGPDEFFTALLDHALRYGCYWCEEHGVITRNVETWKMASSWTTEEEVAWVTNGGFLQSFVLTLLINLGRFGNIPGNRDNWGYVADKRADNTDVPASERMKLVDFSAGGGSSALFSLDRFQRAWTDVMMRCTSPYAFMLSSKVNDAWKSLILQQSVVEHARQCPWLHSQDTFITLMRRVCEDTEAWLFDTIDASITATSKEKEDNTGEESTQKPTAECEKSSADAINQLTDLHLGTTPCAAPALADATLEANKDVDAVEKCDSNNDNSSNKEDDQNTSPGPFLQAFRNKPMPNVKQCSGTKVTMLTEYIEWVDQWDDDVTEFCKWFPFPAVADAQLQQKDDQVQEQQLVQKLQPCVIEVNEKKKEEDTVIENEAGEGER